MTSILGTTTVQEALRRSYLVRGLTDAQINDLVEIGHRIMYGPDQPLLTAGERSQELLVLVKGRARVVGPGGETLSHVSPGQVLGELALIDDEPRSATVLCDMECEVIVLPAERLRFVLQERPEIGVPVLMNLSRVLCERLRNANIRIEAATFDE